MSKEVEMQIPKNHYEIDANKLGEFIWWSTHLGIAPEKLLHIIEKTGSRLEDVRNYFELERKRHL